MPPSRPSKLSPYPPWHPHHHGENLKLNVPDNPIIPFIEGDGTGADIWRVSVRVFDAAVAKAYAGKTQDRLDGSLRPAKKPS